MRNLADADRLQGMIAAFRARAMRRHGIRATDADDIFQDSVVTYLLVHQRYAGHENHVGLLFGIFRRKSLMFLASSARWGRRSGRIGARLLAERPAVARGEDPRGTTLDGVVRNEASAMIRDALESMEHDRRELLLALAERRASRLGLIAATGVNPNTFDSRLRSARLQLRRSLGRAGVA